MAEDFSNRIGPRKAAVQSHERPTREDIDGLLQRHKEHAKRTRPPPQKNFESYLATPPQEAPAPKAPSRPPTAAGPGGHKRVIKV
jgi:hypothetical protein